MFTQEIQMCNIQLMQHHKQVQHQLFMGYRWINNFLQELPWFRKADHCSVFSSGLKYQLQSYSGVWPILYMLSEILDKRLPVVPLQKAWILYNSMVYKQINMLRIFVCVNLTGKALYELRLFVINIKELQFIYKMLMICHCLFLIVIQYNVSEHTEVNFCCLMLLASMFVFCFCLFYYLN